MQHPSVRNLWPDTMNPFSESWTTWRFKFNTLLIILTAKRRSDLTRSLTMVTFSTVFDVQGLPQRGSPSTLSRPSKNALCHLKTLRPRYSMLSISPSFFVSFCYVFIKFHTKFDRPTLLEISFLHFRNTSVIHTLTQLAVKSHLLMLSS